MLKTRRYGYDGKGQAWVGRARSGRSWASVGEEPAVAESGVYFVAEFSVIVARWEDGRHIFWDSRRTSIDTASFAVRLFPCGAAVAVQIAEARGAALRIAEALGHVGVLTVEFFASPRPARQRDRAARSQQRALDDRGRTHLAIRAAYPRHLRPSARRHGPDAGRATMDNLIGDEVERWPGSGREPGAHLHLYGKGAARPGRKMGHVTKVTR